MKKLPIGKQEFKGLIEGDFVYVDKTDYLVSLAESTIPTFLSRPRRFGKSLMVNTFKVRLSATQPGQWKDSSMNQRRVCCWAGSGR